MKKINYVKKPDEFGEQSASYIKPLFFNCIILLFIVTKF